MSATIVARAPINDNDANFRAWGKAISDSLIAGGFTRVYNSADWATVLRPAVSNSYTMVEVFQSAAISGLNRWFIRLDYGASSTSTITLSLRIQVGWIHDGAGNLTQAGAVNTASFSGSTTTLVNCYLSSGAGDWISNAVFSGTAIGSSILFTVERTVKQDLTQNDELLLILKVVGVTNFETQVVPRVGSVPVKQSTAGSTGITFIDPGNSVYNGEAGVCTIQGIKGGQTSASINFFGGASTVFNLQGSIETIESYGVGHSYVTLASPANNFTTSINSLLRHE